MSRNMVAVATAFAAVVALSCAPSGAGPSPAGQPPAPSGTSPGDAGTSAQKQPSPPKPLFKMRGAYPTPTAPWLPLWIANEKGFFETHGLDVELLYLPPNQQIPSLLSGESQMGANSAETVTTAFMGGAELVMLAVAYPQLNHILIAAPDIKTAADLKGKRVGMTDIGSVTDFAMKRGLEHFGLDPDKDVEILRAAEVTTGMNMMEAGVIKAYAASVPNDLRLTKQGFNVLLDEFTLNIPYAQATFITTRQFLREHRDEVKAYLMGMLEGIKALKADKEYAMKVFLDYTKQEDRELAEHAVNKAALQIARVPFPPEEGMRNILKVVAVRQPEAANLDLSAYVDPTPLREIERSGFVDKLYSAP